MQLLFDLDNLLREVLLVPQRASGGEHLPDEGRHGAGGGWVGVKTDWQQWAAVEQSRMYFWASPAPAASQLNFPAPYFPLQGTCTDPHHCLLAQSSHLALPPKYMEKNMGKNGRKKQTNENMEQCHLTSKSVKHWMGSTQFTYLWQTFASFDFCINCYRLAKPKQARPRDAIKPQWSLFPAESFPKIQLS